MPNSASELIRRLDRLEKNNRRLRSCLIATAVIGLSLFFINHALQDVPPLDAAPDSGKVVEAGSFILVDSSGTKRAEWSMAGSAPALVFYDKDAQARLTTRLSAGGEPEIFLRDEQGQQRLILRIMDNNGGLYIADAAGNNRIQLLTIGNDSRANLTLQDDTGDRRVTIDSTDRDDRGGVLRVHNNEGRTAVLLMVDENDSGSVGVFNDKGMGRVLRP